MQLRNKKNVTPIHHRLEAHQVLRGGSKWVGGGYATQKTPRPVRAPGRLAIDTDIYIYINIRVVREYY